MPTERLAMRHVRDVMRLKAAGMPSREIARRVGTLDGIRRFEASGLTWPLLDDVTDTVLEARLFAKVGSGSRQGQRCLAEPDWATVHRELKRKHVTLAILWEAYRVATKKSCGDAVPGWVHWRSARRAHTFETKRRRGIEGARGGLD